MVTGVMAAHDESESNRQQDIWKEDTQRRAGLQPASYDSNSYQEKINDFVFIKLAHLEWTEHLIDLLNSLTAVIL